MKKGQTLKSEKQPNRLLRIFRTTGEKTEKESNKNNSEGHVVEKERSSNNAMIIQEEFGSHKKQYCIFFYLLFFFLFLSLPTSPLLFPFSSNRLSIPTTMNSLWKRNKIEEG